MIFLDADLSPAALIDQGSAALAEGLAGAGGFWLRAAPGYVSMEGERLTEWRAFAGCVRATPAAKAAECRFGPGGLALTAGRNCGLVVENAVPEAACVSLAVLYRAVGEDIRTLASIAPKAGKSHLFLFDQGGTLGMKDREDLAEVSAAAADASHPQLPPGIRVAVAAHAAGRLWLRPGSGAVATARAESAALSGPADLYIGCRNHRESLVKTYGAGTIAAVMLWPGLNVLDPACAAGTAQLSALDTWLHWEARDEL